MPYFRLQFDQSEAVSSVSNGQSDEQLNCTKRVRTPVRLLLHSLSDKYPWEEYEPLIHPAMC